jgi:hypothetical protein
MYIFCISTKVWLQLPQWFLRRRLKCEMLTDGRRTKSDGNSSHGLKARWANKDGCDRGHYWKCLEWHLLLFFSDNSVIVLGFLVTPDCITDEDTDHYDLIEILCFKWYLNFYIYQLCTYFVWMLKSPKQLLNCLKRTKTSVILSIVSSVPYRIHPY